MDHLFSGVPLFLRRLKIQTLTHSRLACYRACHRRHYLQYELGLRRERDDLPRRIGTAFAAAIEAYSKGQHEHFDVFDAMDDPFEAALVVSMFTGHIHRWADDPLERVAEELEFDIPIRNPQSGYATPIFRLRGKIDRIVHLDDGRMALMEYKTTSRDFSPSADYWLRLHMDPQLSLYVLAARELGYDIDTILYDVTRRPALRPLQATPEDKQKFTAQGNLYANQRAEDETPEEYTTRLSEAIADKPDHHFARIEIARLDQDLENCRNEVWMQQLEIRAAQREGHWYKNPGACFTPFKCDYLPICQHQDLETVTPLGFYRLEDVHPELTPES